MRGDRVLQRFVESAQDCIRNRGLLACFGGKEFGIVLAGTPLYEARAVPERLLVCIEDAAADPWGHAITVSFGVRSPETTPPQELLGAADRALPHQEDGRDGVRVAA